MKRLWIAYLFIILGLSSIPGGAGDKLPLPYHMDKVVHFVLYSGFGLLFARGNFEGRTLGRFLLIAALTAGLIGLADEVYQGFIPGRSQELGDWVADLSGGSCGALLGALRMGGLRPEREKG